MRDDKEWAVDRTASTTLLEQHRRDIEALDRRILHLVCERLELARQIGDLKRSCGVPLRNFEVEEQVYRRLERASEDLGLEGDLGRELALFLIAKAVEEQATLMDSDYRGDQLRTLVIGGKGGMGSWIGTFLHGQGHRVEVFDPAPHPSPLPETASMEEGLKSCDLAVVAVPMEATAAVIDRIGAAAPTAVIAEMCSLKGHLQPVVQTWRGRGLRLVSFHPMFGPGVRMLSGRHIVFCTNAPAEDLVVVKELFAETSAELIDMTPEEHDRRMALVLGLTHLSNLALARALAASGVSASDMARVGGVTFEKQLVTTREVTAENPELYYQIQALNPTTSETADWLIAAVTDLRDAVVRRDPEAFAAMMGDSRDFLEKSAGPRR